MPPDQDDLQIATPHGRRSRQWHKLSDPFAHALECRSRYVIAGHGLRAISADLALAPAVGAVGRAGPEWSFWS